MYDLINVKKQQFNTSLTATRLISHNQNSKNQKGAITFTAHRYNVNVLLSNRSFLIFAVLVV